MGASNTNRLNELIRKVVSVIGCRLETMEAVVERRTPEQTAIRCG